MPVQAIAALAFVPTKKIVKFRVQPLHGIVLHSTRWCHLYIPNPQLQNIMVNSLLIVVEIYGK